MPDGFLVLKFLSALLSPPAAAAAGVLAGILFSACGWRRSGGTIAALAVVTSIVLSLPAVADALMSPLESQARREAAEAKPCCYAAIVVLGGGIVPAMPPQRPDPHLVEGGDRIWQAARLFHAGAAPKIIASGGSPRVEGASQSEAQAMAQLLFALGVPASAIELEDRSENTIENIGFTLRLAGDAPVALVTSAFHMPRALRLARMHGLRASAFPTDWQVTWSHRPAWRNWLPTLEAARASESALREHAAAAFDWREKARCEVVEEPRLPN